MSVVTAASARSAYRGYEYYEAQAVTEFEKTADGLLLGKVRGSENCCYDVTVNPAHPKRSSCTCPHASGRQLVCKHMVAVYFTAFPQEAEQYIEKIERDLDDEYAEEYMEEIEGDSDDEYAEEYEDLIIQRVQEMKKSELQQVLLQILFDGPGWQCKQFIRDYVDLFY